MSSPDRPSTAPRRLADIQIRDPFLLTVPSDKTYYLFGSTDADIWNPPATGFDCYRSTDLDIWYGPINAFRPPRDFWSDRNFWAPEVHEFHGRYYMFASFKAEGVSRGTQLLAAEHPARPYAPWSDGPVTPTSWDCLDGTLHIDEAGDPWIVFCHEWVQVMDGQVVAQRLAPDLTHAVGEPVVLFRASQAPWTTPIQHPRLPAHIRAYVTDGPFVHRLVSGALIMLWSSFGADGYAMGIARASSGRIEGPWTHEPQALWSHDGGHGMIGRTLTGELLLTLHQPNETPLERATLHRLVETESTVTLARNESTGSMRPCAECVGDPT